MVELTQRGLKRTCLVSDVLHLRADDAPRLLEGLLVVPVRVQRGEGLGKPVVLTDPQGVLRLQGSAVEITRKYGNLEYVL